MEVRKAPDTQLNIEVSDDGKHVWVDGKEKNIRSSPEGYLTRREQEIPTSIGGGMNCDKHGVCLTFVSCSIIIIT